MFETSAKSSAFFKTASAKLGSFRPSKRLKKTVILVLAVVFVSMGLFKLGKFISLRQRNNLAQAPMRKEQAPQRSVKTSPKTQAQESKPAVKTAASDTIHLSSAANPSRKEDIRLVIKARDNSWVTLKTDGKLVFHRVLEKGRSESWKAKERMDLSLGNAGVVELEVDGQIFSNLGRKGQALKNIVITKKGMDIGR
jgi:cytoskeletal protein RodZ